MCIKERFFSCFMYFGTLNYCHENKQKKEKKLSTPEVITNKSKFHLVFYSFPVVSHSHTQSNFHQQKVNIKVNNIEHKAMEN